MFISILRMPKLATKSAICTGNYFSSSYQNKQFHCIKWTPLARLTFNLNSNNAENDSHIKRIQLHIEHARKFEKVIVPTSLTSKL